MKYTLISCSLLLCLSLTVHAQNESILPGKTYQEYMAIAGSNNAAASNSATAYKPKPTVSFIYPGYPGIFASKDKKDAWRAERDAHRDNKQRRKDSKQDARLNGIIYPGGYRGMKDGEIISPEAQAILPAGEGIRERYKLYKKQQKEAGKPE